MKVSKKLLIAACATIGACFLGANVYAESLTIIIDDPDFYAALKNCAQNGLTKEEFEQLQSEVYSSDDIDVYRRYFRETLYCDNMNLATFDDTNTSFTFEDESDFAQITNIWMPSQGLKNIDDLNKFYDLWYANFAYNEIEYVNLTHDEPYLSGNPIKKTPSIYMNAVTGESYAWGIDALVVYAGLLTHLEMQDEYTGEEYTLPEIVPDIKLALYNFGRNFAEDLDRTDPDSMTPELYEELVNYYNAIIAHYSPENWLYLENATLSEDGKTLKAIDPTKDMLISYRQSWEKTLAESPYMNPCLYPDYYSLATCENGQPSADAHAIELSLKMFQESDEYADIITIKVKSNNPSNPNTSDGIKLIGAISAASTLISGAYIYRRAKR